MNFDNFLFLIIMSNQFKYSRAETEQIFQLIQNKQEIPTSKKKKFTNLEKRDGKFYIGEKQIIFQEDLQDFIHGFYDDPETGFAGRDRLYDKIYREYLGVSRRAVETYLRNSQTAQIHTQVKKVVLSRPLIFRKPLAAWGVDLTWLKSVDKDTIQTVEKDSQCVFTCIDMFSKFAFAVIIPNKTAQTVSKCFCKILNSQNGKTPSTLRTDNGSEFKAKLFGDVCKDFNIKQIFSETYSPKQNAVIERFNKTLKMTVYKFMTQWNQKKISNEDLQKIVSNYNNSINRSINQVPEILHNKTNPENVSNARRKLTTRAEGLLLKNARSFPTLRIGDNVRVSRDTTGEWRRNRQFKKYSYLAQYFYEIYKVAEITIPTTTKNSLYKLLDDNGKLINHFFLRQNLLKIDKKKLIVELDKDEYVVEKILDRAPSEEDENILLYLVKYRGFDDFHNQWILPQPSFQKLIRKFNADNPIPRN